MEEKDINLREWLTERLQKIFYKRKVLDFCKVIDDRKSHFSIEFYTAENKYAIYCNSNYLGCSVYSRKSVTGVKDQFFNRDLSDGDLTDETFERIKNCIIMVESVRLGIEYDIRKIQV